MIQFSVTRSSFLSTVVVLSADESHPYSSRCFAVLGIATYDCRLRPSYVMGQWLKIQQVIAASATIAVVMLRLAVIKTHRLA